MTKEETVPFEKLNEIGRIYGTPTYVYRQDIIKRQCDRLTGCFSNLPVKFLYAIKANDNPFIIEEIKKAGVGFDTVSYEEVILCKEFTNNYKEIFYTENSMSDEEMTKSIHDGVTLNIGSLTRLERFFKHPDTTECCVRINPAIGDGHHAKVNTGDPESKFGIRIGLIEDAVQMSKRYNKKITGIHAHIGSGIKEPDNLIVAMRVLLELSEEFPDLEYINFGGGLPTPYTALDAPFDVEYFAELAEPVLKKDLKSRPDGFTYFFEPGRWFIAEAGYLLCEVQTIKDQVETEYIGVDTGMHHLVRPALYEAWHRIVNITHPDSAKEKRYNIAGNICESGDILGFDRLMPEASIGDILAICDAGAYGMTMASAYNRRSFPAEVMLYPNGTHKVIRPRLTAEDTVKRFVKDCGYTKAF